MELVHFCLFIGYGVFCMEKEADFLEEPPPPLILFRDIDGLCLLCAKILFLCFILKKLAHVGFKSCLLNHGYSINQNTSVKSGIFILKTITLMMRII